MTKPYLLLSAFGDWVEVNGLALLIAVLGWAVTIGGFVWRLSQLSAKVDHVAVEQARLTALSNGHIDNQNVHTTRDYKDSVEHRFDAIDHRFDEIKEAHHRMESKIDRVLEIVNNRK